MGWAGWSGHVKKLKIGPHLATASPCLENIHPWLRVGTSTSTEGPSVMVIQ